MVDNVNPTTQFHPYVTPDKVPQTGNVPTNNSGIGGMITGMMSKFNAGSVKNARGFAQNNSGLVLGGLAALVIGAGLMRKRSAKRG